MQNIPIDEVAKTAVGLSTSRMRRQHELAADFGYLALREPDFQKILEQAASIAAQGVGSKYAKVLKFLTVENQFLLVAGVGWRPEEINSTTLGSDDASPAGYAYWSGQPVISNHLANEHRFRTPDILLRYGIQRAINVPIRSTGAAFGVLEADSDDVDDFAETDLVFMEAIANIVSMAFERRLTSGKVQGHELFSAKVLNASNDCIKVLSTDGDLEFMNVNGICQMQIDDFSVFAGSPWCSLWPEKARPQINASIRKAVAGESSRFEAFCSTAKGEPRWWDVSVSPIIDAGRVERIVAVSRDITERHLQEDALTRNLETQESQLLMSELMAKEVHHRVRNSLQLVNTLLNLQGNLSNDEVIKAQLKIAANRVSTVASVHERLYREDGATTTDAAAYLAGLIQDLNNVDPDRPVALDADTIILPSGRLAPLGLITSELVTNSFKYGKGTVTVRLVRESSETLLLSVEDQGNGLPEDFPKPQGTGLGMRLVRSYAGYGAESVSVDRSAPGSRINVKIKAV